MRAAFACLLTIALMSTPSSALRIDTSALRHESADELAVLLADVSKCQKPVKDELDTSGRSSYRMPTVQQCMNLAPAGTGTFTLANVLKNYSNSAHHDHHIRILNSHSACYIMTVREPADRVSSLLRFAARDRYRPSSLAPHFALHGVSGDEIAHALANASDPLHKLVIEELPKNTWNSQVSYLHGNTCANRTMAIFFVCNEVLTADLNSLFSGTFGFDHDVVTTGVNRRRSKEMSLALNTTFDILSPAMRNFINYELFPHDMLLHLKLCSDRGIFGGVPSDIAALKAKHWG